MLLITTGMLGAGVEIVFGIVLAVGAVVGSAVAVIKFLRDGLRDVKAFVSGVVVEHTAPLMAEQKATNKHLTQLNGSVIDLKKADDGLREEVAYLKGRMDERNGGAA